MTYRHVVALSTHREGTVHVVYPDTALETLCHTRLMREFRGDTWPNTADTGRAANCKSCRDATAMIIREQVRHLSITGLEKVADLIAEMRNGDLDA